MYKDIEMSLSSSKNLSGLISSLYEERESSNAQILSLMCKQIERLETQNTSYSESIVYLSRELMQMNQRLINQIIRDSSKLSESPSCSLPLAPIKVVVKKEVEDIKEEIKKQEAIEEEVKEMKEVEKEEVIEEVVEEEEVIEDKVEEIEDKVEEIEDKVEEEEEVEEEIEEEEVEEVIEDKVEEEDVKEIEEVVEEEEVEEEVVEEEVVEEEEVEEEEVEEEEVEEEEVVKEEVEEIEVVEEEEVEEEVEEIEIEGIIYFKDSDGNIYDCIDEDIGNLVGQLINGVFIKHVSE